MKSKLPTNQLNLCYPRNDAYPYNLDGFQALQFNVLGKYEPTIQPVIQDTRNYTLEREYDAVKSELQSLSREYNNHKREYDKLDKLYKSMNIKHTQLLNTINQLETRNKELETMCCNCNQKPVEEKKYFDSGDDFTPELSPTFLAKSASTLTPKEVTILARYYHFRRENNDYGESVNTVLNYITRNGSERCTVAYWVDYWF